VSQPASRLRNAQQERTRSKKVGHLQPRVFNGLLSAGEPAAIGRLLRQAGTTKRSDQHKKAPMVRDKFEPQLRRLLEPGFRTLVYHMRHSGINTSGPTSCYTMEDGSEVSSCCPTDAKSIGRRLAKYRPAWFEEPVTSDKNSLSLRFRAQDRSKGRAPKRVDDSSTATG
jgi:hypothetical protein